MNEKTKTSEIPARVEQVTFAQYVGRRVRVRRKQLGWTQDDLLSRIDMSKAHLSDVENGKSRIGFEKLYYLASAMGRSTDWFAGGWEE